MLKRQNAQKWKFPAGFSTRALHVSPPPRPLYHIIWKDNISYDPKCYAQLLYFLKYIVSGV